MRVLHVIQRFWPYVGGSERYFLELSTRLAAEGHQVTVVTTDAWDIEHFWARGKRRVDEPNDLHGGVRILRFPVRQFPGPPEVYFAIRRLLIEGSRLRVPISVLRPLAARTPWVPSLVAALDGWEEPVDVIHATNTPFDSLMIAAERLAHRTGTPLLVTPFVHLGEPDNPHVRQHYTMRHQIDLLRRAAAVIVQTPMERDYLRQAGVPAGRLELVGVGVNPSEIVGGDASRFRSVHGMSGPIVTFLGTAAYDKGTVHLIDAVRRLRAEGAPATLVVAGPSMSHVDRYIENLEPADRACVRPLGFIDEQTKRDLLAATDVLALPSRTDSFGIVFLESWLYRRPVVGALAGGIPGVVDDGIDGLLVRFGDVAALAESIRRLLDEPELARRMGDAGYAKVMSRMTWDFVFERIRAIYSRLAGSTESAAGLVIR